MRRGDPTLTVKVDREPVPSAASWFGDAGHVDSAVLISLASSRVDSMFLRFRLLSTLTKAPLSKVDALKLLGISRVYLDRILKDWISLGIVDIRDTSPQHVLMPRMAIYLIKRPVISIIKLDGGVTRVEDLSDLKEIVLAITSKTRQAILNVLGEQNASVKELTRKLQMTDIHKHIRNLLKAGLLLKTRIPIGRSGGTKQNVVVRRNYRSIRFSLEPHSYP